MGFLLVVGSKGEVRALHLARLRRLPAHADAARLARPPERHRAALRIRRCHVHVLRQLLFRWHARLRRRELADSIAAAPKTTTSRTCAACMVGFDRSQLLPPEAQATFFPRKAG